MVVFVGSPGSGKTSFYRRHFAPEGYVHVVSTLAGSLLHLVNSPRQFDPEPDWQNQDTLKTRPKCLGAVRASLSANKSVVVDNTSPSIQVRKEYLDLVRSEFPKSKIRILYFTAHRDLCVHNSFFRAATKGETRDVLPGVAFNGYATNLEVPKDAEGEFHGLK